MIGLRVVVKSPPKYRIQGYIIHTRWNNRYKYNQCTKYTNLYDRDIRYSWDKRKGFSTILLEEVLDE